MRDLSTKFSGLITREKVQNLQREMKAFPQIELKTNHFFCNGMYARELYIPAGVILVGKAHLEDHFFILSKGRLQVTTDEQVIELIAPSIFVSKAGAKRAGLALEDSVCITIHRTNETDLNKIEFELIEPDTEALFDSKNKLLEIACLG